MALHRYLLGPVLGSVRVVLLLPVLAVWLALAGALEAAGPGGAWFVALRVLDRVLGRAALFLLGVCWLDREPRRMSIKPSPFATDTANFTLHTAKPGSPAATDAVLCGDWVVCNHSSYLDLLFLWYWTSGRTTLVDAITGSVLPVGRLHALFAACGRVHRATGAPTPAPLLGHFTAQPILILPEATTSNGRGVLRFVADLSRGRLSQRIHLVGIKYDLGLAHCVHYPLPSAVPLLVHMFGVACEVSVGLTARWLAPRSIYSSTYQLPMPAQRDALNRSLQQIVAALAHCRPLALGAADKEAFLSNKP